MGGLDFSIGTFYITRVLNRARELNASIQSDRLVPASQPASQDVLTFVPKELPRGVGICLGFTVHPEEPCHPNWRYEEQQESAPRLDRTG